MARHCFTIYYLQLRLPAFQLGEQAGVTVWFKVYWLQFKMNAVSRTLL